MVSAKSSRGIDSSEAAQRKARRCDPSRKVEGGKGNAGGGHFLFGGGGWGGVWKVIFNSSITRLLCIAITGHHVKSVPDE